jgi:hypothetical protein
MGLFNKKKKEKEKLIVSLYEKEQDIQKACKEVRLRDYENLCVEISEIKTRLQELDKNV